ncbi:MAG TPA: glycosyltransferase [Candidatus Krumholzibacteria bacterium]|nr:glycosyltransferase [Candidatus Krumholzibacteria bacterium]
MRICLVGPAYPYRGGISHFTQMLALAMQPAHQTRIVSFSRLYPSLLFPGRTQYETEGARVRVDAPRLIDSINPLSWPRAAHAVLDFQPDMVVVQWWHPFFGPAFRSIVSTVKRARAVPVVYLCHNVLPHESNPMTRMLVRWGLEPADAYLVQSEEDRHHLLSMHPSARVVVHPHPTYTQFAAGNMTRDEARRRLDVAGRVLLFFGLIRAYKGLKTLLAAYARVAERLDATLLVVGEFYEDRAPYDALIASLGIGARTRVVDRYIPDDDVATYFMAADVVVLPYVSATQSGITQTAFAFQRPVVVTAVGGLPDVVEDGVTGYVVPPENPEALAEAIERFFATDAALRMSAAIAARAGRFSWTGCVDALLRVSGKTA